MSTDTGYVTLMLISETRSAPLTVKLSRFTWRAIQVIAALLLITFIVVAVTYSRLMVFAGERASLKAENEELRRYSAKIEALEQNLASYRQMLKKMGDLAGINVAAYGIDSAAVGSPRTAPTQATSGSASAAFASSTEPHGFPVDGYLSRNFRPGDANPKLRHYGIDLAVPAGSPVRTTADGEVVTAAWDNTFGWQVVIRHANDYETMYGHNDSLVVQTGQQVRRGEIIAISGNTGASTAPHVHYEIRQKGTPVNPEEYLGKE